MIAMNTGLVSSVGEDGLIEVFGDDAYNAAKYEEGYWYDSSLLQGQTSTTFTFKTTVLGVTFENLVLAYDANGVPGKITTDTVQFPSSLDGLATSSVAPTSTMMGTFKQVSAISLLDRSHSKLYKLK